MGLGLGLGLGHPDLAALQLQLAHDAGRVGLERIGDGEAAGQVEAAAALVVRERREHDGVPCRLEARDLVRVRVRVRVRVTRRATCGSCA